MPAYRMDSPPYQRNHMAFPRYYQPVMEGITPQMNMDPPKSASTYEKAWPCIGGHSYPTPMQFCCGGHHRFPGYWPYAPAYPHVPTSLPVSFSGGYPACPEPFYVPYAPPPHYTMDVPRYEYDKCMPREYHCCGCPNHPLSHIEGNGVKIEEHEPDAEKKVNNVVYPFQLKNHPCPFVWMPPQYMDNRELVKPEATEVGDQLDKKPSEDARDDGQEPKSWNGWFPFDINSLATTIQDGNGRKNRNWQIDNSMTPAEGGKTNRNQQSEKNRREIPFPVIWIPNYNVQEGEGTKDQQTTSPNSVKNLPCVLNSAPIFSCPNGDASDRNNVNGSDLKVGDREENIPIKQMELQRSEPESHEKRVRDIPVKQVEGDVTGKETESSVKRQSGSPKKTSKLPPVCLRVDPLPMKKNSNGTSRSPSPSKKGSVTSTNGTSKSSTSSSMYDKALANVECQRASNVTAEPKPKERTIEVVEMSREKKDDEQRDRSESHGLIQADAKLHKDSNTTEDGKPIKESTKVLEKSSEKKLEDRIGGTQSQVTSNTNTEVHKNSSALTSMGDSWTNGEKVNENETERKADDMIKEEAIEVMDVKERKVVSDAEAAVLIQAAYRGFQMRKWEPLKKLKQIAEISKHLADVRGSIQALEASSNKQIDEREKVTIGETIMRLLLKLDTIQGLHPSFREMRKSLARELTSLQEKLDSVVVKKSQLCIEDPSIGKLMTPPVGSNGECMQEQQEKVPMSGKYSSDSIIQESHGSMEQQAGVIAASGNSSGSIVHVCHDMLERGQDQLSFKNDNPSHDNEKLQSVVHGLPFEDGKSRFSSPIEQAFNEKPELLPQETVDEAFNKLSKDEASGCDISEVQPKIKSELEGIPDEVNEVDMKAWEELPRGVIDDLEVDNINFRKDKENEIEGEEEPQISQVINVLGDNFAQNEESSKMHEMEELPVGLFGGGGGDDMTNSDKHEESRTFTQVLQSGEKECNPALITHSSLVDDMSKEAQVIQLHQKLEDQKENQSNGESDDWVKVEYEQEGLKGDVPENAKVESGSSVENDEQYVTAAFPENDGHGVAKEDACLEVNEVSVRETPEEKVAVKEAQPEQEIKVDAENKEGLSEETCEQRVASPLLRDVHPPKQDGEMDTDKNLLEENEKLRKMMQKLLEAGNEQLTIISNLTERVKDLEKKLAKKKRVKTMHRRPATSKPSFKKSPNNQIQERITRVTV
ncbi:BAG family molecular chaperone regulator 6 [Neltuma alba]|uniref:BAG family molecular chaperone regulator 6 n=1 Tax=Neltuma alba TaxID=207710 RepID=UPI0010A479B6|nr:BAG family molecular chaperone regulator 6 [Prosopis alba]